MERGAGETENARETPIGKIGCEKPRDKMRKHVLRMPASVILFLVMAACIVSAADAGGHYLRADVTNNLKDNANCPGWTDKLQWAIKSGECDSGGGFTLVTCANDQTKTINPGGTVHAECQLNELPAGNFETYCLRVIWCKKEPVVPGSYKLNVLSAGPVAVAEVGIEGSDSRGKSLTAEALVDIVDLYADKSSAPGGRIVKYNWDVTTFLPIETDTPIFSSYITQSPGVYTIVLTVTDDKGNSAKSEPLTVTVVKKGQLPADTCIKLGGMCSCSCTEELISKPVDDASDCPDTCCKCRYSKNKASLNIEVKNVLQKGDVEAKITDGIKVGWTVYSDEPFEVELDVGGMKDSEKITKAVDYPYDKMAAFESLNHVGKYAVNLTVKFSSGEIIKESRTITVLSVTCEEYGGLCTMEQGYECAPNGKIPSATNCPETCCKPTLIVRLKVWSDDTPITSNDIITKSKKIGFDPSESRQIGTSFFLEYGDGTSDNLKAGDKPIHTYPASGIFFARLVAKDTAGNSKEDFVSITINDPADCEEPKAVLKAGLCRGTLVEADSFVFSDDDTICFDGSGSKGCGLSYSWAFGESGKELEAPKLGIAYMPHLSYRWNSGTKIVLMEIKDKLNRIAEKTITLDIKSKESLKSPLHTCEELGAFTCAADTECLKEYKLDAISNDNCCKVCTPKKESSEEDLKKLDLPVECESVMYQGDPADKLDLVFIPSKDLTPEKFDSDVKERYEYLISIPPFNKYANRINLWKVFQPVSCSEDSEGMLVCPHTDAESKCPNDIRIFLAEGILGRASTGGKDMYVGTDSGSENEFVHELGHQFGLVDEYQEVNGAFWQDNSGYIENSVNCDNTGLCSKWTDQSKESYVAGAGCFPGCHYSNAYRSGQDCMMRDDTPAFCPVCTNHLDNYLKTNYK